MNAQCHACIGGTNVREDMRKLEMGVHVVVGTPGRVYDMINRKALRKCLLLYLTLCGLGPLYDSKVPRSDPVLISVVVSGRQNNQNRIWVRV